LSTTIVLLIRHGENDWVGKNRLAGRTPGVHLNEKGRQQATLLAEILAKQPIGAVYSSPLERCCETAQPTAAACGLSVIIEEGVLEADYGEWQGGALDELAKQPTWQLVQYHPSSFQFPGGESMRAMQQRAVDALERMAQTHPDTVVAVFSHADIIRTCMAHYLGVPLDLFQRIQIGTASISALVFHNNRPAVLFMNHHTELPQLEIKKDTEQENAAESTTESGPETATENAAGQHRSSPTPNA